MEKIRKGKMSCRSTYGFDGLIDNNTWARASSIILYPVTPCSKYVLYFATT